MIHSTELSMLMAAVAASPIVVAPPAPPVPAPPALDFSDWCERQKPADIDSVILAWLHAQVPAHRVYS